MLPRLYGYWRSSASWRIRWAFELKKIPYDYIPVNILSDEHRDVAHLARSPMGTLPVLEVAPGDFLTQSMAILFWMEENFNNVPMLFGVDRSQRYKILELCELINADTAPLQTPRAQKRHSSNTDEKLSFAKSFVEEGLGAFEKLIRKSAGNYCLGHEMSAADLFLIPQLYNAKRFKIEIDKYPHIYKVWNHCMNSPECIKSAPESQPDAVISK